MAFGDWVSSSSTWYATDGASPRALASHTVTAGNFCTLTIHLDGTGDSASVADDKFNPNWKRIGSTQAIGGSITHEFWYCYNMIAGATIVTVTSTNGNALRAFANEWVGPGSSFDVGDQTVSAPGTGASVSSGATPTRSSATELVVGSLVLDAGIGITADTGNGWVDRNPGFNDLGQESQLFTSVGTQAATWTAGSNWGVIVKTFQASAGAGVAAAVIRNPLLYWFR